MPKAAANTERIRADLAARGLAHFHASLRGRDLRVSKARDEVVRCVLAHSGSFCVDDLVRTLEAQGVRDVHKGTVYRAMPLLVSAGIVRPERGARAHTQIFERKRQPRMCCSRCGRTVEMQTRALTALQRYLARRVGFDLDLDTCELRGTCKPCQRQDKRSLRAGFP
jgi:Fe2+ or Zn2+ uptake regulation protein